MSAFPQRQSFLPDLCNAPAVLLLVLLAELLAIVIELADHGLVAFSWHSFALVSLYVLWVCLLSAACLCALNRFLGRKPWPWAAAFSYVLILAITAIVSVLSQSLLHDSFSEDWTATLLLVMTHVLIAAVLAGIALRYLYLSQQLRLREQAALQSHIEALQARIRPHFLFNSMNTIASLIASEPEAAETAVEDLSALFRASLGQARAEVSLADELEVCRCYVRIEQARLGEKLQLEWQLGAVPLQLSIPGLTLQPLLENAIYHGIQQLPAGGTVTVRAAYDGQLLSLEVRNPVVAGRRSSGGHNIALQNIRHRLQSLYGPAAELMTAQQGMEYLAKISYPVVESAR